MTYLNKAGSIPRLTKSKFPVCSIYGVRRTIVAPSFYIWPAQIPQLYGGDCPANTVDCLRLTKTYNRPFLANPTDKYARQWSSLPPAWSSTGSHICQLDFLGIAVYIVFINRICNVCAKLVYSLSLMASALFKYVTTPIVVKYTVVQCRLQYSTL